jgi:ATP-dependent DNA helicase RecG
MSLPINIDSLLTGKVVEWERLEFKRSWDKLQASQAITAFANDINNWGGGYLIIGIEENNGQPVLPPYGIKPESIDSIQKELLGICNNINPPYFPIAEPVEFQGKMILVIWAPTSETRPHKAPNNRSKPYDYKYFIRRFSNTVVANQKEEIDLIETSARTPFDDQINQHSSLEDLDINLIRSHLVAAGSSLQNELTTLDFIELCRKMNIVSGPNENIFPKNIGLLLFNSNPTQFFKGAQIDVVQFKDNHGKSFTEKIFTGPIQQQLQDALIYFKNTIIVENIIKQKDQAQALRVFNYPYDAIEEALVNTVYHRSYSDDSPIEVRIYNNRIEMISYPGPLPPLNKKKLREGRIAARKYRNSRMGD